MVRYPAQVMSDSRIVFGSVLLFGLCAAPLLAAQERAVAPAREQAPTVTEDETGIAFPTWLDLQLGGADAKPVRHHLLGTGVREKTIFAVNVYGMGMYADKEALGRELHARATDVPAKKAGTDGKLRDQLLEGKVALSLRMVFARDIDAEDVREAFEDWLQPRLEKAVKAVRDPAERAALEKSTTANLRKFRDYFSADIVENDELILVWEVGGRLHTILKGKAQPIIQDEHMCRAMFDCYIGAKAAEPGARKAFLTGAWRFARAWRPPAEEPEAAEKPETPDSDENPER